MKVRTISPFHHAGRGWAVGEVLDIDGEDLHLLLRAGRVEPVDRRGWTLLDRSPRVSWTASPQAEIARGPAADPYLGRVW